MREVVTGSDDHDIGVRKQGHLAAIPADEVVLVTDPSICLMAARAYSAAAEDTSHLARIRRVSVIRVGNKYVVADPYTPKRYGEYSVWYIFDSHWRRIVTYLS